MPDVGNKATVLTVDDDPIILNSVLETLRKDYVVRPFTSGSAALKYVANNPVDLILLDHNMPEMTGLEVLKVLQDDVVLKSIPVIFLTGSVNSDDEVTALELGATDYLLKPFNPQALQTRVRLQLELFRHRNYLEEMVAEKTREIQEVNRKLEKRDKITLDLLAKASDMRDHDTGTHIEETTLYSKIIVDELLKNPKEGYEITAQEALDVVDAVKLHDLGKLAMPDGVLLKPGRLTEEEFAIIKTHPIYGAEMLKVAIDQMEQDSLLSTALDIAYGHHEKWNGSGYPRGVSGFDIPLSARIAAIADVYDALTSPRPYKKPFSPDEAFDIMYKDAGSHFDPYLIDIVKHREKEFRAINGSLREEGLGAFQDIFDLPPEALR